MILFNNSTESATFINPPRAIDNARFIFSPPDSRPKLQFKGEIDCTNNCIKYSKPKNKERKKRELQRITRENQQILKRIQAARPTYNHRKWEEEAKVNERILANICEFKQPARKDEKPIIGDEDSIFGYLDFGDTSLFQA